MQPQHFPSLSTRCEMKRADLDGECEGNGEGQEDITILIQYAAEDLYKVLQTSSEQGCCHRSKSGLHVQSHVQPYELIASYHLFSLLVM